MTPRVFLIIPNDDEHYNVLIWSTDENSARQNAYPTTPAKPLGTGEMIDLEEIEIYHNPNNSTLEELSNETHDFQILQQDPNCITIKFQDVIYHLNMNEAEIITTS